MLRTVEGGAAMVILVLILGIVGIEDRKEWWRLAGLGRDDGGREVQ
jgi:hypothetical protein